MSEGRSAARGPITGTEMAAAGETATLWLVPYRFLPHTADVAAELRGSSEEALYQAGVDALRDLLVGASPVANVTARAIPRRGYDVAERLVHFLGDVLYLYDTERFLPGRVTATGITGEHFNPSKHHAEREVKAVTHHGAVVQVERKGLRSTIVFDL